jgi:DNA-binding Lrp family transcriptional regulator
METEITKRDEKILDTLLEDSRVELCKISHKNKIPISTIFDRIDRLSSKGIISKFCTIINHKYLRFSMHYFLHIKAKTLPLDFRINSVFSLSDSENYLIDCFFKDESDKDAFRKILKQNKITILKEISIYESIKQHGFRFEG